MVIQNRMMVLHLRRSIEDFFFPVMDIFGLFSEVVVSWDYQILKHTLTVCISPLVLFISIN